MPSLKHTLRFGDYLVRRAENSKKTGCWMQKRRLFYQRCCNLQTVTSFSMNPMGAWTNFTIAGYPLIQTKHGIIPEVMTVFRESDKRVFVRKLGERNPLVYEDDYADVADEVETATVYVCSTDAVIDRLDVMGFTIDRARRDFEAGRQAELAMTQELYQKLALENVPSPAILWFTDKVKLIESLSFDVYTTALRQVLTEGLKPRPKIEPLSFDDTTALRQVLTEGLRPKPFDDDEKLGLSAAVRYILDDNKYQRFGFFASDVRCLIRAACEVAPKPSEVIQDITDLIQESYYAPDASVCQQLIDILTIGHIENANRIILTEGSTDTRVLKESLKLLYPHLSGYYSFLDFETLRVPGGAGQLASLVKGFAAAGIGNRIIAIFDNDSAARDAKKTLVQLRLPSNIAVLSYPNIELLRSYPTLGPSGTTNLDVNGLAASIELYFGMDVLGRQDGSLTPIQWKGYIESIATYQGEVTGKSELQKAFFDKLATAQNDPAEQARQDWSGIDAILKVIFGAFKDEN